ncbi:hypothetical protein D6833_04970 [Candidatus Parcubacteria bacterium]|nr:MAG: hypothetical protein D6833_04970 [Candidatus Parcubacteria bacterium]
MGTRHVIAVVKDGEYKLANYGQWDGYPEGQSISILAHLRKLGRSRFEKGLERLRWATGEDYESMDAHIQKADVNSMDFEEREKWFEEHYPNLIRDTGADIIPFIESLADRKEGEKVPVGNALEFVADCCCEWVYVIDLDRNTLEVYNGHLRHRPIERSDRFFFLIDKVEEAGEYPPKVTAVFSLDDLPTDEELLEQCPDIYEDDLVDDGAPAPFVRGNALLKRITG